MLDLKAEREEWKRQARMQGLQEGLQQLLIRLITRRFGQLSADTKQRLLEATPEQLEQWADKILDAETLEDVFG